METSPRVSVEAVPRRRAFSSARAVSWTRPMLNSSPKTFSSRSTVPVLPMYGAVFFAICLCLRPNLDDGALGARHGPAQQHEVLVREDVHDLEAALGRPLVPPLPRAANAVEDARRRGVRADRARRAHVVRAV